jgi:hypothetical protein
MAANLPNYIAHFAEAVRHLPPSNGPIYCALVGGAEAEMAVWAGQRPDLNLVGPDHSTPLDAVLWLGQLPNQPDLSGWLARLRPGGRFICLQATDTTPDALAAAKTRILAEQLDTAMLLCRGEHAYQADLSTQARIALTAQADSSTFPFLFLLVRQTPNRPAWAMPADTPIVWETVTTSTDDRRWLLAFSALPKAVAFSQPAVLAGKLIGVNKMIKFPRAATETWQLPLLINPLFANLNLATFVFTGFAHLAIDPRTAITGEE